MVDVSCSQHRQRVAGVCVTKLQLRFELDCLFLGTHLNISQHTMDIVVAKRLNKISSLSLTRSAAVKITCMAQLAEVAQLAQQLRVASGLLSAKYESPFGVVPHS